MGHIEKLTDSEPRHIRLLQSDCPSCLGICSGQTPLSVSLYDTWHQENWANVFFMWHRYYDPVYFGGAICSGKWRYMYQKRV